MFLMAWRVSDSVIIHRKGCSHRKPREADQIEMGQFDWTSKEAFASDHWSDINNDHKDEEGFKPYLWEEMDFKNCTDDLPEYEPQPAQKGKAKANGTKRVTGAQQWAAKPIPRAMVQFTQWIAREYPGLEIDPSDDATMRIVMIASKAYGYFQSSDLNVSDAA